VNDIACFVFAVVVLFFFANFDNTRAKKQPPINDPKSFSSIAVFTTLTISSVLVAKHVHFEHLSKLPEKINQNAQISGIAVREQNGYRSVGVREKYGGNLGVGACGQHEALCLIARTSSLGWK
jgi:hypothetical protein